MSEKIKHQLAARIAQSAGLEFEDSLNRLSPPRNREFGDLAFPCFLLAKQWKKSPQECAEDLCTKLTLPEGVESASPAGPFINFRFDTEKLLTSTLTPILNWQDNDWWQLETPQKVIVEYSSPNIAKPFHVGHLRATLIGNSLDRVYRALGYSVTSINHLGDWGTQFGFVWAGCELWGQPSEPTVNALVQVYRRATELKDYQDKETVPEEHKNLPDVNSMARQFFIDLENDEEYAHKFWAWCTEISLKYLKATYIRLGISFDHYTGESFYRDKLDNVSSNLKDAGLLTESQGAWGVDLGDKLGFARVLTPDGRSLYLTRDLATAEYRADTIGFDRCIYVVGAPQTLHFQQVKEILNKLGRNYAPNIIHVPFGHVMGMKTRGQGNFIELNSFIDEAETRALQAYREQVSKRPEGLDEHAVAKAVARSAIMFSTLSRSRLKDVQFKWEQALAFQGDTGPYVLYAYARINGIREKAHKAGITSAKTIDTSLLTEESVRQLLSLLGEFHKIVQKAANDNEPAILCSYTLETAKLFSRCYMELKVMDAQPSVAQNRLAVFDAVRIVLGRALRLLGIEPIERM